MTINLGGYVLGFKAVGKDKVELSVSMMLGPALFKKTIDVTQAKKIVSVASDAIAEAEKMP